MSDNLEIDLPNSVEIKTRKADKRGRISLGSNYANKKITVVILNNKEVQDE